jgi:adenylate cyclase
MSDSRLAGKSLARAQIFWTGVATTLALLVLAMIVPGALEEAANATYDFQVSRLPRQGTSAAPVIIEVDEASLELFGQWPWPRYRLARLLDALTQSGASAVGIDVMFPERDRSSPAEVQQELRQGFGYELSLERVPEGVRNYDRILAASLASGTFVLGYAFRFGDEHGPNCSPRSANSAVVSRTASTGSLEGVHRAKGASCSIPILGEAASAGFVNSLPDDDGIYRRTPLIIEWNGRVYPRLAVQTLLASAHLEQMVVESHAEGYTLRLGSRAVPLDKSGNLLLRFRGPGRTFEYISAADVFSGRVAKDRLQGRTAFVGVTALGLTEYRPTAFDPLFSGVEIHATIADNILRQDFLQRPAGEQLSPWQRHSCWVRCCRSRWHTAARC